MKKIYLLLFFCCLGFTNFATTYYSNPAGGDPSVLTSWSDNPAGGGVNPTVFTNTTDVFIVQSNMLMTMAAWTVYGDVIMNSGYIWSNSTALITLTFHGSLTMNGNTSISTVMGGGNSITVNLYGDMTMTGTSFFNNPSPRGTSNVNFVNAAAVQHLSGTGSQAGSDWTTWTVGTGVTVQLVSNFNVNPYNSPMTGGGLIPFAVNGTIDCQTFNFNGTGAVTIGNGGNLITANDSGINGSILCTATGGTNTFSMYAIYTFDGAAPQVTGTLLPATLSQIAAGGGPGGPTAAGTGTLKIDNPAGVTLSQSTTFSNIAFGVGGGVLALTSGNLTLGANSVTLGTQATLSGPFSGTSMIVTNRTGQLRKQFTANGTFLYPVGDSLGNYTPITLSMAGTYAAGAYAGVTVTNSKDPHNANATDYLNRYWSIALSGITAPAYTVTAAQYVPGDVVGTEANISAGKYPAALPWVKYGVTNTTTHTLVSAPTTITNASIDFTGITTVGPSFTATPSENVCSGTPATLTATTITGDAPATYTWSPASGLSPTTGATVTATPSVTTTYTVTLTDGNGFKASATVTLTVNPSAGTITGAGAGVLCLGQTLALVDLTAGGTWSSTDPLSATVDGSGNVTASTTTTGTPTIDYIMPGGCTATAPLSVVSSAGAIAGTPMVCTGATTLLTDIGAGTWSSSSTAQATVDPVTGVVSGVSPGTTDITYTLAPGCLSNATITVNSSPAAITGPVNFCTGTIATLTDATGGGTWASSNPASASVNSITGVVTGGTPGTPSIVYTVSSGCTALSALTVISGPPAITGTLTICAGATTALANADPGGTWSTGNPALAIINPVTGVATGVSPGTPTVTYTLLPGCAISIPLTVEFSGTPAVGISITPGTAVCPTATVYLTATSSAYPGPAPTYKWIKNGMDVYTGISYHYVPADGDVIYSVMRSDLACRTSDTAVSNHFTITTAPSVTPVVTIAAEYSTAGSGEDDTLVANISTPTPAPSYQWYINSHLITGATQSYYVIHDNGNVAAAAYNCVVTSGDGCNTIGISNALNIAVSDESVKQIAAGGAALNIAPNPSKGTFTMNLLSGNNESVYVVITNILGEKVKEFTANTNTATEVSLDAATGIYLLSASTNSGRYVARIVIN